MICIYKQDNNNYTNNGDAVLIPTVCDLAMTINGAWQLKIEHPYDPEERYKLITEGAIIRIELECIAELETVYQLFRVYQYTKGLHSIEAIAFPVAMESTYDAPIDNLVISGKTGAQAMAQLQTFTNKYTLSSDVTATGSTSYNNSNINEAIASGNDNSFIQVWGGEILYDNYKFKVKTRLGDDTAGDHRVMYGRNLTNIEYEKDDSGIITRISPISQDNIRLDGTGYVDSSHISDYPVAHHKYETAPYTLVDTEATSPSQTATLTRQAVAAVSAQADTLSHSAWTTASGAGYQPEYIKSIKTEITEAVQNMALANVVSTSLYNLMKTTIANAMAWLGDLKQPKWEWMGSDQTGWKYGNATSYAKNMYVKIGKTWSYFGSDGNWQEPKDDSDEWDWHDVKNGTGKKYGNFNKYFAHNEYVYITQSGTIKEYWFNEQGWFEEDESGDSEYYWHGSGTGADPYWFGKDSSTYLKSCWRFIDGTYYFFDSYGYVAAQKDNYQWDWVESGDASRAWFGNAINSEYGSDGSCLKSQWEKINGTWYYFNSDGIVQSEAVSQTNAIAVFTTGMSGLTTTVDNWKGQLYSLLYSLMRSYCAWRYKQKIDLPAITIKVDMADLSKTEEYKDFADLEKIRLGDSVECIDYEHNISTTNRVIGITYDCILKSNKDITIGEAAATVAQMVGNAQGEAVTGGFDTSALETQLAALRNGKQDNLTAGDNITIENNVISASGGSGHGLEYFIETPTTLYGKADNTITVDPAFVFDVTAGIDATFQGGRNQWLCSTGAVIGWFENQAIYNTFNSSWNGVFILSENVNNISLYVKFEPEQWWDTPYENTVTYANCPNGALYTLTSNLKIYAYKDSFEVEGVTYYVMALGATWLPLSSVKESDTRKQLNSCLLYMNPASGSWQGHTDPTNGWYANLGDWGTTLLNASLKEYYNGMYRSGKLGLFAGGEDSSGTGAGFKALVDGEIQLYRHVDGMDADAGYIFNQATWTKWTSYDTSSGVIYRKANNKSAIIAELRDNASYGDICRIVIASRDPDGILWDWARCNPSVDPSEPTTAWSSYTDYPYTPSHYSTYEFGYQTTTIEYDGETWHIMGIQPPYMDRQTYLAGDIQSYTDGNYFSDYTISALGRALLEIANAKNYTERFVKVSTGNRIFEYIDDNNLIHYINADGSNSLGADVEANPSGTATSTLTKIGVDGIIYGIDAGSEVIANPSETASTDLTKVGIDGTVYGIPEGTTVIANPSGTATTDLTKLQVENTIYNIPSGGGSGDLSAQELTYAQWQALTEQEKMAEVEYHITDYPDGEALPLVVENGKLCIVWQREVTS